MNSYFIPKQFTTNNTRLAEGNYRVRINHAGYSKDDDGNIRLEIVFDQTKLFVFAKEVGEENATAQAIAQENYDVVILNKNQQISQYFDKKCNIFGFYDEENVDFSFEKQGTVCCKISGEKMIGRCLD